MSAPFNVDPRMDQAAISDEALIASHEKLLGKQPDDKAHYSLMTLILVFIFSGLILFSGIYQYSFSSRFDPMVYDETAPKQVAEVVAANPVEAGKKVYQSVCMACHQANGLGLPGAFPPLAGSEWVVGSEERVIRIALHGMQGPVKVKGTEFISMMPATGKVAGSGFNLGDDRIAHALTYIRQEWGNQAGPIAPEKVAEIHTKEGNRPPWTAAELEKLP